MLVGGVIVVLVAAVLLLTHVMSFGRTTTAAPAGPDATPVSLPVTVGAYRDIDDVIAGKNQSAVGKSAQAQDHADTARLTVAAYQQAFPGAGIGVRQYADADLEHMAGVIAVRAQAPGLTLGLVTDPAEQGLVANYQEVRSHGDAQCLVINQPIAKGQPADDSKMTVARCQKASKSLTVWVSGSGFTGPQGMTDMVDLVDHAYSAVAGSGS